VAPGISVLVKFQTPLPLINVWSLWSPFNHLSPCVWCLPNSEHLSSVRCVLPFCKDLIPTLDDSIDLGMSASSKSAMPAASGLHFRRSQSMFQHMIRVFRDINHFLWIIRNDDPLNRHTSVFRVSNYKESYKAEKP